MLWIKQIGDTPIPPQFEDESSVHVQAYVYLSDLFWSRSYFFIPRVLINLFSGCHLCMGHAVDKDLLSLVQREVKGIIADLKGHDTRLTAVETKLEKDEEARREEIHKIMKMLVPMENMLSELMKRVEGVEQRVEGVEERVEGVEQRAEGVKQRVEGVEQRVEGAAQRVEGVEQRVERVEQGFAKTNIKVEVQGKRVERVEEGLATANVTVEGLGQSMAQLQDSLHEIKRQRMEDFKPGKLTIKNYKMFQFL